MPAEPPTVAILRQCYGTLITLESYLCTILKCESAEHLYKDDRINTRLKSRRADLASIYVGLDRCLIELALQHIDNEVHVQSIADIIKSVQLLLFRKRQNSNILLQGYQSVSKLQLKYWAAKTPGRLIHHFRRSNHYTMA